MGYIIGQIIGLLTIVCSVLMPYLKKKSQLLWANIAINGLVLVNLVLIGQFGSANWLCMVAIVQSLIALPRTRTDTTAGTTETVIFTFLYLGFGIFGIVTAPDFVLSLNRQNLLELLPILGALSQMISVFVRDEQTTRFWLLCNAVFWMIYSGAVGSSVVVNDALAVVSTASALYKYRKKKA